MIQQILAVWFLVPLPFLNLAWVPESSNFMYYWSLAWRILSITFLACEMSAINLNILRHFHSLGLGWRLTLSSPVVTAEFSKFAGILSAALSQHHLLGFCHGGEFWQNVVHWRRKLQTTSAFLPWYSHEQYEKKKMEWVAILFSTGSSPPLLEKEMAMHSSTLA